MRTLRLASCLALVTTAALAQPRAAFSHAPPDEAPAGQPYRIEGNLTGGPFARLVVQVRGPGEEYRETPLELQYGDLYRVTLPASRMVPPGIEYFIEGVGRDGKRALLFANGSAPVRVTVPGEAPQAVEEPRAKCKKGRKCREEPSPAPTPKSPDEAFGAADTPARPDDAPPSPPVVERAAPEPAPARAEVAAPVARGRRELEEELALYAAEAPAGFARSVDEGTRGVPQMPSVLTAAELKRLGVRYVSEALELLPGVSVSRDVQGHYRIAVRGLRSDAETLVTLNGQRLNNFYDAKALLHLPVDNLERIELHRGPASAEVGLGNVVAAIHLVTRRDEGLRVAGTAGLHEAFDGHVNAAGRLGAVTLFADADVVSQFGERRPVFRDGLDSATSQRPKTTRDQRFLVNAGAGASLQSAEAGTFELAGRFLFERRSALLGLFDVVGPDSRLEWTTIQAQAGWRRELAQGHRLSARLWFDQQATARLWQLVPDGWQVRASEPATLFPDGAQERVTVGTRGLGLEARGEFSLPARNVLVAGLTAELQSLTAFELVSNLVPGTNVNAGALVRPDGLRLPTESGAGARGPAADRLGLGLFAHDTWSPVEAVTIQAGLRVDLTQLPRADATGQWLGTALMPSLGPRLGLTVAPTRSLVLRGHYGRSFRAPTPQELADPVPNSDLNQGRFVGNPQLQGAALDAVEAGVEYVQGVGDGTLRLTGNGFFERMTNAIVAVDTTGNLVPYRNRALGVQALGLEGGVRLELAGRLSSWLNVSWVRAEDLTAPIQSRILTDVPQLRLNAGLSVPVGPWLNLDLVTRVASERRNDSRSVLELIRRYTLPAHTTVAAQLRTERLFDVLELAVLGQNVFAAEYADDAARPDRVTAGVPRETYSVFATARVGF